MKLFTSRIHHQPMKRTTLCPAPSIFSLLLPASALISSEPSPISVLRHPYLRFLSRGRRRFRSIPGSHSDDPNRLLSYVRNNCRAGGFASVDDALFCFRKMMQTNPLPSSRDFSLLLGAVVRMKRYSTAIGLIEQLRSVEIEDDHFLTISLNCFCRLRRVDLGLSILGRILKLGFPINVVTSNTLIDGLFIQGKTGRCFPLLHYKDFGWVEVTSRKMHTWKWMAFDHGDGLFESGAENYCGELVLRLLSQVMYLGYLLCFLHAKWPSLRNGWLTLEHG